MFGRRPFLRILRLHNKKTQKPKINKQHFWDRKPLQPTTMFGVRYEFDVESGSFVEVVQTSFHTDSQTPPVRQRASFIISGHDDHQEVDGPVVGTPGKRRRSYKSESGPNAHVNESLRSPTRDGSQEFTIGTFSHVIQPPHKPYACAELPGKDDDVEPDPVINVGRHKSHYKEPMPHASVAAPMNDGYQHEALGQGCAAPPAHPHFFHDH
eukprot:g58817.t1